jgi:hypothetical protein
MPMIPGPLAAITYGTIKVAGYAGFGYWLNRQLGTNVRVWKFGLAKTAIGLAGGLAYFFFVMVGFKDDQVSEPLAFAGAIPIRAVAWTIALNLFYKLRSQPFLLTIVVAVGVLWSYILDGAMALIYHLPGMAMPLC